MEILDNAAYALCSAIYAQTECKTALKIDVDTNRLL